MMAFWANILGTTEIDSTDLPHTNPNDGSTVTLDAYSSPSHDLEMWYYLVVGCVARLRLANGEIWTINAAVELYAIFSNAFQVCNALTMLMAPERSLLTTCLFCFRSLPIAQESAAAIWTMMVMSLWKIYLSSSSSGEEPAKQEVHAARLMARVNTSRPLNARIQKACGTEIFPVLYHHKLSRASPMANALMRCLGRIEAPTFSTVVASISLDAYDESVML